MTNRCDAQQRLKPMLGVGGAGRFTAAGAHCRRGPDGSRLGDALGLDRTSVWVLLIWRVWSERIYNRRRQRTIEVRDRA